MVILPMVAATPASAGGLTHHLDVYYINEDIPSPGNENPCGFFILLHQEGNIRINYWTDENGNWIREFDIFGNLKRIATAFGKTIDLQIQGPIHYEYTYLPDEFIMHVKGIGTAVLITVPGYGRIFSGAGQFAETYVYDTKTGELISHSVDKTTGNQNIDPMWTNICAYFRGDLQK
jgi:hypothetical protein